MQTTLLALGTLLALWVIAMAVRDPSRGVPGDAASAAAVVLWSAAMLLRSAPFRLQRRGKPRGDVLIVGAGPVARATGQDARQRGRRVVGHLQLSGETEKDVELLERTCGAGAVLGLASEIERVLRAAAVDEVFVAGNVRAHGDEMQAAVQVCEKLGVPFALPAFAFRLERAHAVESRAISDGYLHYQTVRPQPVQLATKRLFDVVVAAAALWVLSPLFAVVVVLIKLTSRGPIFFRQTRVGLHGREFAMLKFRSMVANAEALKVALSRSNEQSGPVFKIRNDPRITVVGRFIRKYSIDELPQLINVLRGEMSIVGPRPPVPQEVAQYDAWQRRRLSVRPGLTCIWQVSGRNQISFEQWMYLDMQYIDHWSLARDLNLFFRTFPVVISGRGAS
jgi:exopolysaccharide biosynthesis polyprenyl glycosylphosphotransferase